MITRRLINVRLDIEGRLAVLVSPVAQGPRVSVPKFPDDEKALLSGIEEEWSLRRMPQVITTRDSIEIGEVGRVTVIGVELPTF